MITKKDVTQERFITKPQIAVVGTGMMPVEIDPVSSNYQ